MSSFKYNYPDDKSKLFDYKTSNVVKIIFDISRFGKYKESITFDKPVSKLIAVNAVEKFLSEPFDINYFDKIKDDLLFDKWEHIIESYYNEDGVLLRGDILGDCIYIDKLEEKEPGVIVIICD